MKVEKKIIIPFYCDNDILNNLKDFANKNQNNFTNDTSMDEKQEILKEFINKLKPVVYATSLDNFKKNDNYVIRNIYSLESLSDIQEKYKEKFLDKLNDLLSKSTVVCDCNATQFIKLKNRKLKSFIISEEYYKESRICETNKYDNNENVYNCVNHSKNNLIVLIDGEYKAENPCKIPLTQIVGGVNFATKEVIKNPLYNPENSANFTLNVPLRKNYVLDEKIEFRVPMNVGEIKDELMEEYKSGEDYPHSIVEDILFETAKYLNNLENDNRLNVPDMKSVSENLLYVLDYANMVDEAYDQYNMDLINEYWKRESNKRYKSQEIQNENQNKNTANEETTTKVNIAHDKNVTNDNMINKKEVR